MEMLQLLPDNILRRQVCQECFQYLSVPPIRINSRGEPICGRCLPDTDISEKEADLEARKYTKSHFNTIAASFSFKCTNHLNGCSKILALSETAEHEKTCAYQKQDCFFCSFSGNLSQVLNHSLKFHPENVCHDGTISFSLSKTTMHKNLLSIVNDNVFYVVFNMTNELVTIIISPVALQETAPIINQYGIRFFNSDNPTDFNCIHTDYGLLNNSMETYFQKSKAALVTFFGLVTLNCEILMEQFSLNKKEIEFQKRYINLRRSEEQLHHTQQQQQQLLNAQQQQLQTYNSAMDIIKRMSSELFKCGSCQKIIFKEFYFCPKNHGCCKSCLTNVCKACKSVQEFTRFDDIENFLVPCDWAGCKSTILLKKYLQHKKECLQRPYKCPLLNCQEVLLSSKKFIEHWHCVVPKLTQQQIIECELNIHMEYYWLIKQDLYHVLINLDESVVQVLIDEINVLPNNVSFSCTGFVCDIWKPLTSSTFCGKFQVNTLNSYSVTVGPQKFSRTGYTYTDNTTTETHKYKFLKIYYNLYSY